jgi:hypothetical protein
MGLVEVVEVEREMSLGRPEDAEVRDVRIAAQLHADARPRRRREIGRHDRRSAAEEREGRDEHPPVTDRGQLGDPGGRLLLENVDRVRAPRRRFPLPVAAPRRVLSGCLAASRLLGGN